MWFISASKWISLNLHFKALKDLKLQFKMVILTTTLPRTTIFTAGRYEIKSKCSLILRMLSSTKLKLNRFIKTVMKAFFEQTIFLPDHRSWLLTFRTAINLKILIIYDTINDVLPKTLSQKQLRTNRLPPKEYAKDITIRNQWTWIMLLLQILILQIKITGKNVWVTR